MRIRLFLAGAVFILAILQWGTTIEAFEIQFPGEDGFFIGKPMIYKVTANASNDKVVGQEGVYTFGPDKILIADVEYYDCTFSSDSDGSHFYFGIDLVNNVLIQKGIKFGLSELSVDPPVVAIKYPLAPGAKWTGTTKLTAKNIVIPGFGALPRDINVENVNAETTVSSEVISVSAGIFDTLLVKNTYSGTMIGIPVTLVQRTWLSAENIPIKRNFEFMLTSTIKYMLYEIELSKPNPNLYDLNWDNIVNILDVIIVAKHFGEQIQKSIIPNPDINVDGVVDIFDLEQMIAHFGERYKE